MKRGINVTTSVKNTQKLGASLAKKVLRLPTQKRAVILGLFGNLGEGKTTFLQGFARGLGVKNRILSPTFVVQKRFEIKGKGFKNFYHIDCYRLRGEKDILSLGFEEIVSNPQNIVAIEWPEKIKKILPRPIVKISLKFIDQNTRELNLKM